MPNRVCLAILVVYSWLIGPAAAQTVMSVEELDASIQALDPDDWKGHIEWLCRRSVRLTRLDQEQAQTDAESALRMARESKDDQALAWAYNAIGVGEVRRGHMRDAYESHTAALAHALAAGAPLSAGRANLSLARCALHAGDLDQADDFLLNASAALGQHGTDSDRSDLHNLIAVLHQTRFELKNALEQYVVALRYAEEAQDTAAQSRLHYNLGTLNANLDDTEGADASLKRALELQGMEAESQYTGLLYAALGGNARDRGEYDSARTWFERGRSGARKIANRSMEALHLRHLAALDFEAGNHALAEAGYRTSLELSISADQREAVATSSARLAEALVAQGQFDEATLLCESALAIASDIGMPTVEVELTSIISDVYASAGEFEMALELQRRHTSLMLEIESEMRSAETNRLRLQVERVESERDRNLERRAAEAKGRREALLRNGGLGGALVLGLVLIAVTRNSRQKTDLNQRLERQNRAIAQTNETVLGLNGELERTLREVRQLSGLLPICCHCKSIRNDDGYWCEVEGYISEHSEALFTHGICPDCLSSHYEAELN